MADMLQSGVQWLQGQLKASASRKIEYRRGLSRTANISATLGSQLLRLGDDQGGTRMKWTDRDYLIAVADLTISAVQVTPAKGDVIADSNDDGTTVLYEVLSPGGSPLEPEWRYSDPFHTIFRIHTKPVGTE